VSREASQLSPASELCLNFLLGCIVSPFISLNSFLNSGQMNVLQFKVLIKRFADELRPVPALSFSQ